MTKKLKYAPYAQCRVEIDGDKITFISYATPVIFLDKDETGCRRIECTGTYSQTTRKQIGRFLKEFAPDLCYADMKKIAGKGAFAM